MSLSLNSQCLLCHLRRNVELARTLGTEEQTMAFARDLMRMYLQAPGNVSAPWFGPETSRLLQEHYGLEPDRFRQEKIDSNAFVMERLDVIRQRVESALDPVLAGLQFSILGNYLDFTALQGQVSFDKLAEMLEGALEMELDRQTYDDFCRELETGKTLLYLTDNAGEIGFDRVFAETLQRRWPHLDITFCVRGGIAQNDATREDARAVGIPFRVIDNGNAIAGTQLDQLGSEAKYALEHSDVIFAKGMANAETMSGCGYNVFYAFLIKCQRFMSRYDRPMLTPMLVRER